MMMMTTTSTSSVKYAMATATTAAKSCDYVMQSIRVVCNVLWNQSICLLVCMECL